MRAIPRALTATAVGAALVLFSAPSGAQEGDGASAPRAEAQSTALRLSLFGNQVVISGADTAADSAPSASAEGTGALLATTGFGQSSATADAGTPTAGSEDPVCSPLSLPPGLPLPVEATTACSHSSARAGEGAGTATAGGEALTLGVLTTDSVDLPISEVTDEIIAGLEGLLGTLPVPLPPQLDALTEALQDALEGDVGLIEIEAGLTESTSTASAGSASATSSAEGVVVTLLDRSLLGLEPVLTLTVGRSVATATWEEGGDASAEHVTAPVTIEIAPDIAGLLGVPADPIPVTEGQVVDLPLPAPLTSRVSVAGGEDTVDGVSSRAVSSNIRLDLATGLPGGGVVLAVADAAAAVEGVAVEAAPPPERPAGPPTEVEPAGPIDRGALPRTGGDGRWVPIGVLLAVAAGVSYVTLRCTRRPAES